MALCRGQARLGRRRDGAAECVDHWRSQMRGQLGRLVEAARPPPARMERHRHDTVRVSQQVGSVLPHQGTQRRRQRVAPVVLEEVHESTEGAFVGSDCPAAVERRRAAAAAGAAHALLGNHPPGR